MAYYVFDGKKWRISPGEPEPITRGRNKGKWQCYIQAMRKKPEGSGLEYYLKRIVVTKNKWRRMISMEDKVSMANELLKNIDQFLAERKVGEIVDEWAAQLYIYANNGIQPDWAQYPLGAEYYRCYEIQHQRRLI